MRAHNIPVGKLYIILYTLSCHRVHNQIYYYRCNTDDDDGEDDGNDFNWISRICVTNDPNRYSWLPGAYIVWLQWLPELVCRPVGARSQCEQIRMANNRKLRRLVRAEWLIFFFFFYVIVSLFNYKSKEGKKTKQIRYFRELNFNLFRTHHIIICFSLPFLFSSNFTIRFDIIYLL